MAHDVFKDLSLDNLVISKGVIYDVKGILPEEIMTLDYIRYMTYTLVSITDLNGGGAEKI